MVILEDLHSGPVTCLSYEERRRGPFSLNNPILIWKFLTLPFATYSISNWK